MYVGLFVGGRASREQIGVRSAVCGRAACGSAWRDPHLSPAPEHPMARSSKRRRHASAENQVRQIELDAAAAEFLRKQSATYMWID